MNTTVIMYVGLAVAAGILIWGTVTLIQHSRAHLRKKKPSAQALDSWITIRPLSSSHPSQEKPNPLLDAYLRGQENGFFSKSKKLR